MALVGALLVLRAVPADLQNQPIIHQARQLRFAITFSCISSSVLLVINIC